MGAEKKLVLVYPQFPSGLFASVSPGLLSAAAQAHQHYPALPTTIWDERIDGEFDPSGVTGALVGITTMTAQVPRAKRIAERAREAGAYGIVFGGIHPTVLPAEFAELGSVVRGEVEGGSFAQALADYVQDRPLAHEYATPVVPLENLPLAHPHLYEYALRVPESMISDSRGCPLSCSYCSVQIVSGKKIRHRPAAQVVAELRARKLLEGDPNPQITFTGDAFGFSPQDRVLLEHVCAALDGRDFHWLAQIGLGPLNDDRFLELANSVGHAKLIIGVESPFRDGLSIEKNGIRGINPASVFEKIRKYPNLRTRLLLMLGFDFEPRDAFEQMLGFIRDIQPDGVYISILTPFPGTQIGAKMIEQGRIRETNWAYYDTRHLVFERHYQNGDARTGVMPAEEFMTGFKWLLAQAETEMQKWSQFADESRVL